jgi:hypothetical protein
MMAHAPAFATPVPAQARAIVGVRGQGATALITNLARQ